ncbi:MAG: T9SS type A sorting domain-containing protein, partial [Ignavibacteria bacterium]
ITALYQASAPLTATAQTVSNVTCYNGSNGSATVSPNGGIPPYSYSWNSSPVQTTQTTTGLRAGVYTVTVTDSRGTMTTANATITQPNALTNVLASTLTNVGCFGGNNGSATVTNPTGGTPPYTYQWNTNPLQVTQTATNLTAGTYIVTVTDSKGCTDTSSVTITQPAQPLSNVIGQTIQHVKCNGSSTGSVTVSDPIGGTPPYTYKWNTTPEQKTQITTNLSAGTYSVMVTDSNGCTASSFATVNEPTKITNVQASVLKSISCYGESDGSAIVSDPIGGTPPYSYQWNTVPVQNTQVASNLKAGEYVIIVTDANGCIAQSLISITQPSTPLAISNAKVDKQVSCFGESDGAISVAIPTGGTAPYTIAWNTNPVQKTYSISNLKAGTYTAIITDANGCNVSTSATVTEQSQVVVSSPKDTTVLIQTVAFMKAGTNNPISTCQWQTNTGTGFSNLQNVYQYSGVTTNTLRIENCTSSNHNQPFRCIISTNGCLDTSAIAVLAVRTNVSVKGYDQMFKFTIAPNPTGEADQFLVRFTEIPHQDVSIELLDILGSIHYSNTLQAGSESCTIPVQGLNSGMYMLRVRMNNEVFIEKVIVN